MRVFKSKEFARSLARKTESTDIELCRAIQQMQAGSDGCKISAAGVFKQRLAARW